ncbi:hypothetical protein JTE90_011546 [Oedothorax gibbosus]|uniref:Uncharacterized protein n=1 Tax=Oedothorax gibbosus TaxID=931172 RepID=A0AAV6UIX1_9ARAC|nr:hypothetical protein JTE90_011546 [Oedothorax gibbosus]
MPKIIQNFIRDRVIEETGDQWAFKAPPSTTKPDLKHRKSVLTVIFLVSCHGFLLIEGAGRVRVARFNHDFFIRRANHVSRAQLRRNYSTTMGPGREANENQLFYESLYFYDSVIVAFSAFLKSVRTLYRYGEIPSAIECTRLICRLEG